MTGLLEPAFVRELESIRRRLTLETRSGRTGARRGVRRGGDAEFAEHRPYSPGDDVRRLDFLALARSGQPVVKVFSVEEDALVRLAVDASASMGTPRDKIETARRIAAAIGYLALASSERAQIVVLNAAEATTRRTTHPPHRGRGGVGRLLRELAPIEPDGRLDLARAIGESATRARRRAALVVISDFLDPGPVERALAGARTAGHDLHLVQVLSPAELSPSFEGDLTLCDVETNEELTVTMDGAALDAYRKRLESLFSSLRRIAKMNRGTYVRVATDEPLEDAARRFVARAID